MCDSHSGYCKEPDVVGLLAFVLEYMWDKNQTCQARESRSIQLKGACCCAIDWSSVASKRIELSQHQRRKRGTRQPKSHPVPGRLP